MGTGTGRTAPRPHSLFRTPICHFSAGQAAYANSIFQKILAEQGTDYLFKNDLIRTYIQLLIHEALRMQPAATFRQHHTQWEVAAIGYGLGFEYASYFNNLFKKHTGRTPLAFRKAV